MKKTLILILALGLLTFALVACGGGPPANTTAPEQDGGGSSAAPPSNGGENTSAESPTESAAVDKNQAPEDVPLMDGAYEISIERNGTQIKYKVDAEVQAVVDFYHDVLPPLGWEIKGPPDSVVGSIASMLRKNANGDQLSINMQYNPNAQFTIVTIAISRK